MIALTCDSKILITNLVINKNIGGCDKFVDCAHNFFQFNNVNLSSRQLFVEYRFSPYGDHHFQSAKLSRS